MMRFRTLCLVLAACALLLSVAACSTTPTISNATLGTQVVASKITDPGTTFTPQDHMIQLVVDVNNVLTQTTVGAKWYMVGSNNQDQLLFSSDLALDPLNTSGEFALTSTNDLAPGNYKVVVWLNGKEDRTLNFTVK